LNKFLFARGRSIEYGFKLFCVADLGDEEDDEDEEEDHDEEEIDEADENDVLVI